MNKSQILNSKALSQDSLDRAQSKLQPFLHNVDSLTRLKKVISKYETMSDSDIDRVLHSNIAKFKPITQRKIRDFISRRESKSNNLQKASSQSDTSHFISPSSRESFSSRSDCDNNHDKYNIQAEVQRLWVHKIFQREICQLLYDHNDLEVCSKRSVSINFQQLKQSSLMALTDYIDKKTQLLTEIYKDEDLKIIFHTMSEDNLDEQTIDDMYSIIDRYETMSPNQNGIPSIQITSLKPETKISLSRLFKSRSVNNSSIIKKETVTVEPKPLKNLPVMNPKKADSVNENSVEYGSIDKEMLKFIHRKLINCKSETMNDIMIIIRDNEPLKEDASEDSTKFDLRKFSDVTKQYLYKYCTELEDSISS